MTYLGLRLRAQALEINKLFTKKIKEQKTENLFSPLINWGFYFEIFFVLKPSSMSLSV